MARNTGRGSRAAARVVDQPGAWARSVTNPRQVDRKRVPPKTRHRERRAKSLTAEPVPQQDDPRGFSAPSHMGGQFDDGGYGSGHGTFGFTHDTIN